MSRFDEIYADEEQGATGHGSIRQDVDASKMQNYHAGGIRFRQEREGGVTTALCQMSRHDVVMVRSEWIARSVSDGFTTMHPMEFNSPVGVFVGWRIVREGPQRTRVPAPPLKTTSHEASDSRSTRRCVTTGELGPCPSRGCPARRSAADESVHGGNRQG